MNPHDEKEHGNYVAPATHPSGLNSGTVNKRDYHEDLVDLVCSLQTPHKHSSTCLRLRKGSDVKVCRFNFPKKLKTETTIEFEPHGKTVNGDIYYRIKPSSKRNDPWINNYNPALLRAWRAHLDLQLCLDPVQMCEYIAKYTAKSEKATQDSLQIFRQVLEKSDYTTSTLSLLQKIMLQSNGLRDWAMSEVQFVNLGCKYVNTNCTFETVCLSENY